MPYFNFLTHYSFTFCKEYKVMVVLQKNKPAICFFSDAGFIID